MLIAMGLYCLVVQNIVSGDLDDVLDPYDLC